MRPAQIFFETVGVSARYQKPRYELLLGFGDSGYGLKGTNYNTIPNSWGYRTCASNRWIGSGSWWSVSLGKRCGRKPSRTILHPGLEYEDYIRQEFAQNFLLKIQPKRINFPMPELRDAQSFTAIGYLGFGGFGPIIWNNFYARYEQLHPLGPTTEFFPRGNLQHLSQPISPTNAQRLHLETSYSCVSFPTSSTLHGLHSTATAKMVTTTYWHQKADRTVMSTVLRGQVYMTDHLHLLVEGSAAQENPKMETFSRALCRLHLQQHKWYLR